MTQTHKTCKLVAIFLPLYFQKTIINTNRREENKALPTAYQLNFFFNKL